MHMKSGLKSRGFTIIETLIFLAVSGALLASAFTLVAESQNKTAFNQAINDVQQQINAVINNVANGYYSESSTSQKCEVVANKLTFSANADSTKGTSNQCIFLGRMIVFGSDETYTVYNLAGRRQISGKEVTSVPDALPTIIPNSAETYRLKNGITFQPKNGVNAYVFINGLGEGASAGSDQLVSGYKQAGFYGITYSDATGSELQAALGDYDTRKNSPDGYSLCFDSGTTNQNGLITIGGNNRTATSSLQIRNNTCATS